MRSTVSTVESGGQNVARGFWQRCDEVLGTGATLAASYDQRARLPVEAAAPSGDGRASATGEQDWEMFTAAQAVSAYRELGWCAVRRGSRVELVCGSGVEALEVPGVAGCWRSAGGCIPRVRPMRCVACPACRLRLMRWPRSMPVTVSCSWSRLVQPVGQPGPGRRSTIPVPPSAGSRGQPVVWACSPPRWPRLADPVVLLDLLARATALTREQRLRLPGGIDVIPVTVPPPGDTAQRSRKADLRLWADAARRRGKGDNSR